MKHASLTLLSIFWLTGISLAQNLSFRRIYSRPGSMVYGDTVFLFTSHDEDSTLNNFFTCSTGAVIHQPTW
jgi:hypothetical protein